MKARIVNKLDKCPDDCGHLKLKRDSFLFSNTITKNGSEIVVTIDCEHRDICRLLDE